MSSPERGRDGGGIGPDAWADDAALSRLHRALAREDTPAQLDAAILAAARRNTDARPHLAGNVDAPVPVDDAQLSRLHALLAADTPAALDEAILARARQPKPDATLGERTHDDVLGGVHRAYSTEDTPPELDRRVLDLAAVRGRRHAAGAHLRRLRVPLALAAALVLGLALTRMTTLFMPEQPGPNVELLGGSVRAPQPWLEDIRQLVRAQRLDEAREELKRFAARYPERAIPEDLAGLLSAPPEMGGRGR